ncbi:MAG: tRNA pseudouridine synthase A [Promethearchaeota archaeon]
MEKKRYLLKMYYIGTEKFYGSQRQKNLLTIEDCLIATLKEKNYIKNFEDSGFEMASRTDRFVSARGAVFSFVTKKKPILIEINSALPEEIGIWACAKVPLDFLSRFNAIYRFYKYIFPEPLSSLKKKFKIDLEIMKKACNELEGRHDFVNFSKRQKEINKTIKDMDSVKMNVINDYLMFDFKSRSFLRQQIRRMIKKILELGTGEIDYRDFLKLFDGSNYISYPSVDPSGLILWDIKYESKIKFKIEMKSKERMERYFLNQKLKFAFKNQLFKILQQNDSS